MSPHGHVRKSSRLRRAAPFVGAVCLTVVLGGCGGSPKTAAASGETPVSPTVGPTAGGESASPSPLAITTTLAPASHIAATTAPPRVSTPAAAPAPVRTVPPRTVAPVPPVVAAPAPATVYYANCTAVRNAGVAPLKQGQPGYRAALDRDHDGQACETG